MENDHRLDLLGERGHRLSPLYTDRHYSFKCYQFAVQFKRQPHYFLLRSPFFFLSPLVEAGIFIARTCRHRFCNGSRSVNEDRRWEKSDRYVKLERFSVSIRTAFSSHFSFTRKLGWISLTLLAYVILLAVSNSRAYRANQMWIRFDSRWNMVDSS